MRRFPPILARGAVAALGSILLAVATVAFVAPPVSASPPGPKPAGRPAWSMAPYSSAKSPTHRFFFVYTLHAGEGIEDHVELANLTTRPIKFALYPSGATNASDGGAFTLAPPSAAPSGVGTWIRFGYSTITVPARRILILAFVLTVPAGMGSGDYAGGIVAVDESGSQRKTGPIGVGVQDAIGLAVYVRVSGPINPALAVSDLKVVTSPIGAFSWLTGEESGVIEFSLDNVGNSRLNATAKVSVTGTFGGSVGTFAPLTVDNLLPGSQVLLDVPWKDIPELGVYHVNVSASSAGASGGAALAAAAANLDIDLPWVTVVLAILVLLALATSIGWRHRRKRRHKGEEATSAVA